MYDIPLHRKTLLCSAIPFRYVADEQSPAGGDHGFFFKKWIPEKRWVRDLIFAMLLDDVQPNFA